jgi:hypothetical protein
MAKQLSDEAQSGAQFFQGLQISLDAIGSETLFSLLRATATGFGTSDKEPAGHLALSNAIKRLKEAALQHAGEPWLAAEFLVASSLLEGVGRSLEQKYFALMHGGMVDRPAKTGRA